MARDETSALLNGDVNGSNNKHEAIIQFMCVARCQKRFVTQMRRKTLSGAEYRAPHFDYAGWYTLASNPRLLNGAAERCGYLHLCGQVQ